MQLQAAGAGLPSSMAAGLPPGFLQAGAGANAAAALAAAGLPGLPPGFLGGMPPASVAAHMAAAGIRPPGLPPVTTASVSAELAARAAAREEDSVKAALSMFFESLKTNNIFISLAMSFIPIFSFSGTSSANSDDRNVSQFLKNHQHHVLAKNILLTSLSKSFTNLMHYVLKETFKILENNENEDRRKLPAHLMMRFYDFSVKLLKMPKNPHKSF